MNSNSAKIIALYTTLLLVSISANQIGSPLLLYTLLLFISATPVILLKYINSIMCKSIVLYLVALSILFHQTTVTRHLWGWDIHMQYYAASYVYQTGTIGLISEPVGTSIITISTLPAMISHISGLSIVWIYKIIYPAIYALAAPLIYWISIDSFKMGKFTVLTPFSLIFFYGFFKVMPGKQAIAVLFSLLFLYTTYYVESRGKRKAIIQTMSILGIILSHYGTSVLFFGLVMFGVVVRVIRRKTTGKTVLKPKFPELLVILSSIVWIAWYSRVDLGLKFNAVTTIFIRNILKIFSGTAGGARSGAAYASKNVSLLWVTYKGLYAALLGAIFFGVLAKAWKEYSEANESLNYDRLGFAAACICVIIISLLLPFGMGFDRILTILLAYLAPFAVYGAIKIESIIRVYMPDRIEVGSPGAGFPIFLAVMFLFSSGLAFAAAGSQVPAYAISMDRDAGWPTYSQEEVTASRWTAEFSDTVGVYNPATALLTHDALLMGELFSEEELIRWSGGEIPTDTNIYITDDMIQRVKITPKKNHVVYSSGSAYVYSPI